METTLTNVNAYENAVRTQAGAADIRAQLLDSLAKSKAVVDSVFGKIEEIDRMKAESEQLRKKISTVIPGKATMLTMLSVLSLLVFGLFGAPVVFVDIQSNGPGHHLFDVYSCSDCPVCQHPSDPVTGRQGSAGAGAGGLYARCGSAGQQNPGRLPSDHSGSGI